MNRVVALTIVLLLLVLMGCDTRYGGFQSEEEPNNDFFEANEFQGVTISWTGIISSADDQDFYTIYLGKGKRDECIFDNLRYDLSLMLHTTNPLTYHASSNTIRLENGVTTLNSAPYTLRYYLMVEKSYRNTSGNYFGKYVVNLKKVDWQHSPTRSGMLLSVPPVMRWHIESSLPTRLLTLNVSALESVGRKITPSESCCGIECHRL